MGRSRHIERYPYRLVIHKVSGLLILHMVLHTGTTATGGLRSLVTPRLRGVETYGILVHRLVLFRVQRTYNLIIQHTLVIVHIPRVVRVEAVQLLSQLRKVIGTAGLVDRRLGAQLPTSPAAHVHTHRGNLRIGLTEHLAIAHTAHRIAVASLDHRPEVLCHVVVVGILVTTETAQRTSHHRYVLVGVARTDGIHVHRQRVEEGGTVEIVGCFQQTLLLRQCPRHLRQTRQRLGHATHLAGYIHVPHLITVTRLPPAFVLTAISLHVGPIVQTVPYPETHVLRYQQGLIGHRLVVDIGRNVYQARQLLVHRVVGGPYPTLIIVGTVHLYQHTVLRGNRVQVPIAVSLATLLIAIEVGPTATHLLQLLFGSKVPGFPVPSQLLIPYKRPLLALTQPVNHLHNPLAQLLFLRYVLAAGKTHRQRRHIMARAMALQLRRRRVPAVRLWVTFSRESIRVTVVIQLLPHWQAQQLVNIQVTVPAQTVLTVNTHRVKPQRLRHRLIRDSSLRHLPHRHLSPYRIAARRRVVTYHETTYLIPTANGIHQRVRLSTLPRLRRVLPPHLTILTITVTIPHPQPIRQPRSIPHSHLHTHALHTHNTTPILRPNVTEHQRSHHHCQNSPFHHLITFHATKVRIKPLPN